jgi:prophage tail gpP-like protein
MPKTAEIAVLNVGSQAYQAWETFWLRRGISDAASTFAFTASEPIDSTGAFQNWRIQPGDSCNITLAGIPALTGKIDIRQGSYNSKQHGVMFQGRSLTRDAVDASVQVKGGQFKNYPFQPIANALLASVGVPLVITGSPPNLAQPFENFSVRLGETIFMAIERLARMRGMAITDDAQGNLVAAYTPQAAGSDAQLVEGVNILEARATIDVSKIFDAVRAYTQSRGGDNTPPQDARSVSATAGKAGAPRTKVLHMEEPGTSRDAAIRAAHEMSFLGRAEINCRIVVQGWQSQDGTLWDINKHYFVSSPMLDLERTLISQTVVYSQSSEAGTLTTLELCTPESAAYSTNPLAQAAAGAGGGGDSAYSGETPSAPPAPDPPDYGNGAP